MKSRFFYRIFSFALILHSVGALPAHASTEQLAAYIKVWGYLKYFHPDVTAGKVDWDSEFVAVYPLAKKDLTYRDAVDNLLKAAGPARSYGMSEAPIDNILQLSDIRWMDDTALFSASQRNAFQTIYSEKVPEETRYINSNMAGNANFDKEDSTNTDPYPDEAHRVLAIARHWNAIEYFNPNLDLIPSWGDTLEAYLGRISDARDANGYQLAMLQYCCSICDAHSATYSVGFSHALGEYFLPLPLTHIGRSIIFRKPRLIIDVPFKPGDSLISVDGESVQKLIEHYASLVPRSNENSMMRNVCRALQVRSKPDSVPVVYKTADGHTHKVKIKPMSAMEQRAMKPVDTGGASWRMLNDSIGYVNMSKFTKDEVTAAMDSFSTKRAIIFDIRNYPKETAWPLSLKLRCQIPWAGFRRPYYHIPGVFEKYNENPADQDRAKGVFSNDLYKGKVIVLVNDETQSQAEYTSMMFHTIPGSIIIGSQTAGADGNISNIQLPGGITTIFSGLGVYYPDGKPTQQIGIVPDIVMEPTIAGLRAGRDEVLEKAIEIAKQ